MLEIIGWASRRILFVIALTSVLLPAEAPAAAQNLLGAGMVTAQPGDSSVAVPVFAQTDRPLSLLSVELRFDPALCGAIENVSLQSSGRAVVAPQAGWNGCPGEGVVRLVLLDLLGGAVVPAGNGPIANWIFDVRGDAPIRTFPLAVTVNAADDGPVAVPVSSAAGSLLLGQQSSLAEIPTLSQWGFLALVSLLLLAGLWFLRRRRSAVLGLFLALASLAAPMSAQPLDVNDDGQVTAATDLTQIARHLLGLPAVLPPDPGVAARIDALGNTLDVDQDGEVRVATDLVYIARFLANETPLVPARFRTLDPGIPDDATLGTRIQALLNGGGLLGDQTIPLGSSLQLDISVLTPQGATAPLAFSAQPLPLPSNSSLSPDGLFFFRPAADQVGTYNLTFGTAGANGLAGSESITITVLPPPAGGMTVLEGRLLDTNDFVLGTERPVVGAEVSILGTGVTAVSGPDGRFRLTGIPDLDPTVLDIDTSAAQSAPDGSPYAGFREQVKLIAQAVNVVDRPFFLPRIDPSSLTPVNPSATTVVTNPNLGASLTVPPQTARNSDGSLFTGSLSISLVPEGLAPAALPDAFDPGILVTIQPVGVEFSTPVPITFPNVDNLPPGSEVDIWSLDPLNGEFVIVGTARVSANGSVLETISGGIIRADWHFPSPAPPEADNNTPDTQNENQDPKKDCNTPAGSSASVQSGCLQVDHTLPAYRSLSVSRALRLIYKSEAAFPRPIINADTGLGARTALPVAFSAELEDVGGIGQQYKVFTEAGSNRVRHAVQLDARAFPTGRYPYTLKLTSHYALSAITSTIRDFVLVNNQSESPFGAGWTLEGLQRLHRRPGQDVVSITEGDGSIKAFIPQGAVASGTKTDVAFVMDGSGSISGPDFQLQLQGFASAVEDPLILRHDGAVAVTVVQFAGSQGRVEVPLTRIDSLATAQAVAAQIRAIPQRSGGTPLAEGVNAAVGAIGAGTAGARQVICVSTDGQPNSAPAALAAADAAVAAGIEQIDAIGVGPGASITFLEDFVRNGSVFAVANFQEFARSIGGKLQALVGGSPAGEFSVLLQNPDGTLVRELKDGTRLLFDARGLQTHAIDRNGNTTLYAYDTATRLTMITDPAGRVTAFRYGADGLLDEIEDPAGRITRFEHDANGNLTGITDADSSSRSFSYDGDHLLTSQIDKRAGTTGYLYDENKRLVGSVLPDGTLRSLAPSQTRALVSNPGATSKDAPAPAVPAANVLSKVTDGNGRVTDFRTDRFGGITRSVDPLGRATDIERNANGLPVRIAQANGAVTEFEYDQRGNLLAMRQAVGTALERTLAFAYEPVFHQVTRITDTAGHETLIDYDAKGNPVRVTDALGGEVALTYDGRGLVLTRTDENGNTTTFTYDTAGNLTRLVNPLGNETRLTTDAAGNVTAVTEAFGTPAARTTTYSYDALNRLVSSTDGTGAVTLLRYDAAGNLVETVSPTGEALRRTYDSRDRLIEIADPISGVTRFTRDGNGNVTQIVDNLGRITRFTYDAANQLLKTTDALGNEQEQTYDVMGNVISFSDARGGTTTFVHDLFNRRVSRTDPQGSTHFQYDKRDNLTVLIDAASQTLSNAYDALSRLVETRTPDNVISYDYDAVGNLLSVDDNDSSLRFTYDAADRPLTTQVVNVGVQPGVILNHTFNAVGNRTELSDSLGGITRYSYDAAARLTRLVTPANATIDLTYDTAGRRRGITFPNGVGADLSYDAAGRLTEIDHHRGATSLASFLHTYNTVGNITSIAGTEPVRNFTYDDLDRLLTGGTAGAPESYTYDAEGNRVTSHLSALHNHDAANQLLEDDTFSYVYYATGNLIARTHKTTSEVTAYTYDAQNQLTAVDFPDATRATYRYDGLGRRIEKNVNGTITRYVYDGEDILLEFNGAGALVARYSHGDGIDEPLSQIRGGASYFYHADHQGSIRKITDAVGNEVSSYEYDTHGQLIAGTEGIPNPYTYTGREQDPESGLLYYRARSYDPRTGRFLQEDPLGFAAGDANLYRYVFSNPVNLTDPDGMIIPALVVWAAAELALSAYDVYDTVATLSDPCASGLDKALSAGGALAGALLPGGGYGAGGKAASKAIQKGGAQSVNAADALARKLAALEKAQSGAARTKNLPDGRVRYYTTETPARTAGPTRGASLVTEHNPQTGQVRQWMESYDHAGNVVRVHPKMINGQVLDSPHFPPTGRELGK